MKCHWLNKENNKNLIVFFAGWSFDSCPFVKTGTDGYDILIVFDYNNLYVTNDLKDFSQYENKTLICWSMGVFCAYLLKDLFNDFDYKIAINGTTAPVDDKFGIPSKVFELTLKHAAKGLEEKFYRNIFSAFEDYDLYTTCPVRRTIANRVSELENLYNLIKNTTIDYKKFYDTAIVSDYDKIIPPQNQIASHKKNNVPIITVPCGHWVFYYFKNWDEIIKCCKTVNI